MHCPECGFVNTEGANYCQKCGAFLSDVQQESDDTTAAWQVDETGDIRPLDPEAVAEEGTLVIRAGGGRAGETFTVAGDQMRIGRSPEAEIFLDDVTVSRNHAVLTERDGGYTVEDQGSLNGTFVNRRRIDTASLENGDELQIGKYRMTFIA
jgi:pSer/pThr/pTyr-binding forkhead associated (FHA) protein